MGSSLCCTMWYYGITDFVWAHLYAAPCDTMGLLISYGLISMLHHVVLWDYWFRMGSSLCCTMWYYGITGFVWAHLYAAPCDTMGLLTYGLISMLHHYYDFVWAHLYAAPCGTMGLLISYGLISMLHHVVLWDY